MGKRCLDSARGKSVRHLDSCRISHRPAGAFPGRRHESAFLRGGRRHPQGARLAGLSSLPSLAGAQAPVARGSGDEKSPAFRRAFAAGLHLDSAGDSYRIQTCNLLIRSQMLYSVELRSRYRTNRIIIYASSDFTANLFSWILAFLPESFLK